jgi:hypothetical protein
MKNTFEMSDLGELKYYLEIEVLQNKEGVILKQSCYAKELLKDAKMFECNPTRFPMEPNLSS